LIVSQADPAQLYRYPEDRAESQNLVDSSQGKAVMSSEETQLWNQVNGNNPKAGSNPPLENKIAGIPK